MKITTYEVIVGTKKGQPLYGISWDDSEEGQFLVKHTTDPLEAFHGDSFEQAQRFAEAILAYTKKIKPRVVELQWDLKIGKPRKISITKDKTTKVEEP